MDRKETIDRIITFVNNIKGFDDRTVRPLLEIAVPPQVAKLFITDEALLDEDKRPFAADVGMLTHDGLFVGITVYEKTIEALEWHVNRLQEISHEFREDFYDVSFSLSGLGQKYYLRARKSRWNELSEFVEALREARRG